MIRWYRQLKDIPNLKYENAPNIQRTQLPGHDLKPEVKRLEYGTQRPEYLLWNYRDGTSSTTSPAKAWASQPIPADATPDIMSRHLHQVLELPGETADYHFAIQSCFERLWSVRREHPSVIQEIEKLCWLDIYLLEALPDTLRYRQTDGTFQYAHSIAFERLIHLYERNGYLVEALDVAKRATQFHADDATLTPLRERLARLENEHGD